MTPYDTWLTTQPEEPETCPQCGGDNSTEDGDWLAPDHIPFCSAACQVLFDAAEAEAERRMFTCPRCLRHLDDHTVVIKNDPEFGDYETIECPESLAPVGSREQDFADRTNALFDGFEH